MPTWSETRREFLATDPWAAAEQAARDGDRPLCEQRLADATNDVAARRAHVRATIGYIRLGRHSDFLSLGVAFFAYREAQRRRRIWARACVEQRQYERAVGAMARAVDLVASAAGLPAAE